MNEETKREPRELWISKDHLALCDHDKSNRCNHDFIVLPKCPDDKRRYIHLKEVIEDD